MKKTLKKIIYPALIFIPLCAVVIVGGYFASVKLAKDPSDIKYSSILKKQFDDYISSLKSSKSILMVNNSFEIPLPASYPTSNISYITTVTVTQNDSKIYQYFIQFSFTLSISSTDKQTSPGPYQQVIGFVPNSNVNSINKDRIQLAFTTGDVYNKSHTFGLGWTVKKS